MESPNAFLIGKNRVMGQPELSLVGTAGMIVALAPSLDPTYGTQRSNWPVNLWIVLLTYTQLVSQQSVLVAGML